MILVTPADRAVWTALPAHRAWLATQMERQLVFARDFAHPGGGAAYLGDDGRPDLAQPVFTYVTARMAYVYSLGCVAGLPGCRPLAATAVAGLCGVLRDDVHGGWFASIGPGAVRDETKAAYAHAFVVLAASSAAVAEVHGARALLEDSLAVLDQRFWEEGPGLHRDSVSRDWSRSSAYRGVNANMHSVEALLAAADATGEEVWLERAVRITMTVLGWAAANEWRVPEHFDEQWRPMMDHHRDRPDHAFEPYGATVGHGLEWSRLALHVAACLGSSAPEELLDGARRLFHRAVADGWAVDGADGFVYTTDWDGAPVVRQRMHWVLAEAISAAGALHQVTGEPTYDAWYRTWWDYAATHLIAADGSWQHELDASNVPAATVWPGRPDIYHSLNATLLPRLPLAPCASVALARGLTA